MLISDSINLNNIFEKGPAGISLISLHPFCLGWKSQSQYLKIFLGAKSGDS